MDPKEGNTDNLPEPAPAPAAAQIQSPPGQATPPPLTPSAASPLAAQDGDRIEREWILKTRQILAATVNDPRAQAQQLAALRADYMAKRYNKVIQAGE